MADFPHNYVYLSKVIADMGAVMLKAIGRMAYIQGQWGSFISINVHIMGKNSQKG